MQEGLKFGESFIEKHTSPFKKNSEFPKHLVRKSLKILM